MLDESSTLNVKLSIATLFSSIFVIISKASNFDKPGITVESPFCSNEILFSERFFKNHLQTLQGFCCFLKLLFEQVIVLFH